MGRIRSLKPEWLEDEKLASLPDAARLLSVGLILLADDQGRGRSARAFLGKQVWGYHPSDDEGVSRALTALVSIGFVTVYQINGEQLYEIRNWSKHQRIDHPGKPRLPAPGAEGSIPVVLAAPNGAPSARKPARRLVTVREGFDRFWAAYPKKVAKADAEKMWARLPADGPSVDDLIAAVEAQKSTDQWRRNIIPNAATWLNGGRWQDEVEAAATDDDPIGKLRAELAQKGHL